MFKWSFELQPMFSVNITFQSCCDSPPSQELLNCSVRSELWSVSSDTRRLGVSDSEMGND